MSSCFSKNNFQNIWQNPWNPIVKVISRLEIKVQCLPSESDTFRSAGASLSLKNVVVKYKGDVTGDAVTETSRA
jgi:hypothetical protein